MPRSHGVHSFEPVDPLARPLVQLVQTPAPFIAEEVPAAHDVQLADPSAEYWPLLHTPQVGEPVVEKRPAAQKGHSAAASGDHRPASHLEHELEAANEA